MKQIALTLLIAALASTASADIVCKAETQMGPAVITIADDSVTVSGAGLSKAAVFRNLESTYDGHMTAMTTAPGLSVSYENWYGCIHNAQVTTSFRDGGSFIQSVRINRCSGGSTPDNVCHVN